MKVTYSWLKELVAISASPEEIAARLTAAGLEVTSLERRAIPEGVVVAELLEVTRHSNADHLTVCTVAVGSKEPLTIVCGAPNVRPGMKVPLATIGTMLSPDFIVKKATLRGVTSSGMLCSERELGISDNHDGIMNFPSDYTVGIPLRMYIPDDTIFEIELTPNRGDCLSVLGIAREVSAQYNTPLKNCARHPEESGASINDSIVLSVLDSTGCPRYTGRLVRGVTIGESPQWLKNRLTTLGIRPINNVVDVTNYVLLLFGQPMHAFDYATIAGKKIIVKRATEGLSFTTLDEVERKCTPDDLLICDAKGPTALAGIMGGAGSGISETTTDVFLECAYFDPVSIRKTSKRLGLSTDSSYRFERGVDPEGGLIDAIDTAAALILELAGGAVAKDRIDVYHDAIPKKHVLLRPSHVERILGITIDPKTIVRLLASLQIRCIDKKDNGKLHFEIPSFRHDLSLEIDLVEEVGRLYGYDTIPTAKIATITLDQHGAPQEKTVTTIRTSLAALGLHETVTNTMVSEKTCTLCTPAIEPVVLLNPLNPDMSRLRTTMLGSLLTVTAFNINRKNSNNKFFELGKIFIQRGHNKQPVEQDILAILLEGDYCPASWIVARQPMNFYLLKGVLVSLQNTLGIPSLTFTLLNDSPVNFYTNESAQITGEGVNGTCGLVKTGITKAYSIKTPVYYAELDLSQLLARGIQLPHYTPSPRFPAVERDFCFIVDEHVLSTTLVQAIRTISPLVEQAFPFDVYRGEKLAAGKKSIAFSVHLRAEDRTLTDKEAETISTSIIHTMKSKYNAVLREQ